MADDQATQIACGYLRADAFSAAAPSEPVPWYGPLFTAWSFAESGTTVSSVFGEFTFPEVTGPPQTVLMDTHHFHSLLSDLESIYGAEPSTELFVRLSRTHLQFGQCLAPIAKRVAPGESLDDSLAGLLSDEDRQALAPWFAEAYAATVSVLHVHKLQAQGPQQVLRIGPGFESPRRSR
jgi:hypothetical protein